jgi:hypothetical protein
MPREAIDIERRALQAVLDPLLRPSDANEARLAAIDLYALLARLGLLDNRDAGARTVAGGVAIGPQDAARCVMDFVRTQRFLQGIRIAVADALYRFPERPLHLLYAGCGPLAPLVLPLFAEFPPGVLEATLIDCHAVSLASARLIVESLGFDGHVRDYVCDDAGRYRMPADRPAHVLVVEAMQRALAKEPQAAITANLAPQLAAGGIVVPKEIALSGSLADLGREFSIGESAGNPTPRVRVPLGDVLTLAAGSGWLDAIRPPPADEVALPPVVLAVPASIPDSMHLLVQTFVTIVDGVTLGDYESAITSPAVQTHLDTIRPGAAIEARYVVGRRPEVQTRILPTRDTARN